MGLTGAGTAAFAQELEFVEGNTGIIPAVPVVFAFVNATEADNSNTAGTSVTVNAPATINSGDTLVAVLQGGHNSGFGTITPPSGFTQAGIGQQSSAGATLCEQHVYVKTAGASEPTTYAWSWSTATFNRIDILHFSGASATLDGSTPGYGTSSGATTVVCPTATATNTNDFLIVAGVFNSQFGTWTNPAGFNVASPSSFLAGVWYKQLAASGATGTTTLTYSSSTGAMQGATILVKHS